jgi:hypothetical protein
VTESPKFIERPADLSVSNAEGQGMWAQIDAGRIGLHNVMLRLAMLEAAVAGLVGSMKVVKILLGIPCLLATAVLLRVLWMLSAHDAHSLLSMVSP